MPHDDAASVAESPLLLWVPQLQPAAGASGVDGLLRGSARLLVTRSSEVSASGLDQTTADRLPLCHDPITHTSHTTSLPTEVCKVLSVTQFRHEPAP